MIIAKKITRNKKEAMDRIMNACMRTGLAEKAIYQYARGGTDIEGASIRLAEAIAQNWGNIQYGIKELEQRNGESTVEAYAWDTETNTRAVKVFQISHIRHTKQGTKKLEDPRDIYEMVANNGARRLRACILGVIPVDIVEEALEQCNSTLSAQANITPEVISQMLSKFEAIGVTKEMIELNIQRRIDTMTPALLIKLRKIYNSIKDGMSQPLEWFELPAKKETETATPKSKTEQVLNNLKSKKETPSRPLDQDELPEGAGVPIK
jgi:hypothetical protein